MVLTFTFTLQECTTKDVAIGHVEHALATPFIGLPLTMVDIPVKKVHHANPMAIVGSKLSLVDLSSA